MTKRALFDAALAATKDWHAALPQAAAFCDWPTDLAYTERAPHMLSAANRIQTTPGTPNSASAPLLAALQALAPHLEWRHTYSADEVGHHFLDHFGWFELAGPTGHFVTRRTRITVGYWGAGLHYGRHHHTAEELYTVVAGHGTFHLDGAPDLNLLPGDTRFHASDQPHALTTTDSPILTLVFWRGDGLADPPRLTLEETAP
ncbi:MAG: dimethylsulfonioproprionate lyase family protein [Pseudomonadota bacterium]